MSERSLRLRRVTKSTMEVLIKRVCERAPEMPWLRTPCASTGSHHPANLEEWLTEQVLHGLGWLRCPEKSRYELDLTICQGTLQPVRCVFHISFAQLASRGHRAFADLDLEEELELVWRSLTAIHERRAAHELTLIKGGAA
jgi:hypothetical protein